MLRRLHTYMSMISAPIILFFCLTGSLQLFGWHESRGAYHAPPLLEKLGMLHKKQRFEIRGGGPHGAPPSAGPSAGPSSGPGGGDGAPAAMSGDHDGDRGGDRGGDHGGDHGGGFRHGPPSDGPRVVLLRWVFLLATLSLVASTVMGAWIGLTHAKRKRLCWLLLATGTALPVLILAL